MLVPITLLYFLVFNKEKLFLLNCIFFKFTSGIIVEGSVHVSTLPDQLLDQQPSILELTTYARTAEWNQLGVQLQLDSVDLAGCHDCTSMYQLWIMQKAREATRRSLLVALRAIRQNDVGRTYEVISKQWFVYTIYTSIYTCMCR